MRFSKQFVQICTHFLTYYIFLCIFRSIKSYLEQDYGPNREYAILQDQCFEYTDREYTYKYCPFSKGSQRPKNGGHETSLGYVIFRFMKCLIDLLSAIKIVIQV